MKKIVLAVASMFALVAGAGLDVSAQSVVPKNYIPVGGVGPVVSGSTSVASLPKKAQKFIDKLGQRVVDCEREYSTGGYDVKLESGLEIDFDSNGKITEIDAPDNAVLGDAMIKEVVPGHLYSNLREMKLDGIVTSIESKRDGYMVEFAGSVYEEALFSHSGDLIALYYED